MGSLLMVELGSKKLHSIQHASLPGRTQYWLSGQEREKSHCTGTSATHLLSCWSHTSPAQHRCHFHPLVWKEKNGDPCVKLLAQGHSVGKNEPRVQTWLPITLVPNTVPPSPVFLCPSMYVMLWAGHWAPTEGTRWPICPSQCRCWERKYTCLPS